MQLYILSACNHYLTMDGHTTRYIHITNLPLNHKKIFCIPAAEWEFEKSRKTNDVPYVHCYWGYIATIKALELYISGRLQSLVNF